MLQNFENLNVRLLFSKSLEEDLYQQYRPDIPFSDRVVEYLNALSVSLVKDAESRMYPDVVTFAFFCRKANLLSLKKRYTSNDNIRLGRGILFHIAPSNVAINFAYSLVVGLLSGNYNIVRVSTKEFPQVDLIVKHIQTLSEADIYKEVSERIVLVRYERTSDVTDFFSSICNVRIIWGGDTTIAQIRKGSLPARSFDVTFADRYSIAVIQADKIIQADSATINSLAESFYNDTYLFDQNACSSPHLVVWLGDKDSIKFSQQRFWTVIQSIVERKYKFQNVLAVDKLTTFYRQSVSMPIEKMYNEDNSLVRVCLGELPQNMDQYRCAGGYFSEFSARSLDEIVSIINNKYQTLAYYGIEKTSLIDFVVKNRLTGIDRIVPIGRTLDFSTVWDGYDLINTLSRECYVV